MEHSERCVGKKRKVFSSPCATLQRQQAEERGVKRPSLFFFLRTAEVTAVQRQPPPLPRSMFNRLHALSAPSSNLQCNCRIMRRNTCGTSNINTVTRAQRIVGFNSVPRVFSNEKHRLDQMCYCHLSTLSDTNNRLKMISYIHIYWCDYPSLTLFCSWNGEVFEIDSYLIVS